ncbi:MAG: SpoIIIAC/SpoIIIAD family protein [Lachnospiraceae bacterium]|jgi:stage III sporulation protein AD
MEIMKIAVLGIAGMLLGLILRESKSEYSMYMSLAVSLCIFFYIMGKLRYLFDSITEIQELIPVNSKYLTTIMKMIGITYIGQFTSGICKDAGFSSIGNQIEIFSKLTIMAYSLPVLLALMETIHGFLS